MASASDQGVTPVGKVIFATGSTLLQTESGQSQAGTAGMSVYVGQTLSTQVGGHLHVQMIDGALLVLRPESSVKIAYYTVDMVHPSNTKILLDMQKGVVRSVTGKGGQANKQGFRLNTPVAAIGIKGTDFTVLASQSISSVSLKEGGVIVSPFSSLCPRYTVGACSGSNTVLLTASDQQMLAEVREDKAVRVPKVSAVLVPDQVAPVHPAEEKSLQESRDTVSLPPPMTQQVDSAKTGSGANGGVKQTDSSSSGSVVPAASASNASSSAGKLESSSTSSSDSSGNVAGAGQVKLVSSSGEFLSQGATAEVAPLSPVTTEVGPKESVTSELVSRVITEKTLDDNVKALTGGMEEQKGSVPASPVTPPVKAEPIQPQPFYWGRWARYAGTPEQAIALDRAKSRQIFATNRVYLLADSEEGVPQLPKSGKVSFALDKWEANTLKDGDLTPVLVSDASLDADFDQNRFKTGLRVSSSALHDDSLMLHAEGSLSPEKGTFQSETAVSNMTVSGAFSNNANHAAYEFHDVENEIFGVTNWKQK